MDSDAIVKAIYKRFVSDLARIFEKGESETDEGETVYPLPTPMLESMKEALEKIQGADEVPAFVEVTERIVEQATARLEDARTAREVLNKEYDDDAHILYLLWGESGDGEGRKWWDKLSKSLEQADAQSVQHSGFTVKKDLNGNWRWFGWATNNFVDRENEVLTDSAHREFLNYLDENPDKAPELWTWHTPGTAKQHKTDWWEYANGFFMYSGILTEEEAQGYLNLAEKGEDLGMSHGFYILDRKGPFITRYRTFEVSDLPLEVAANPYTSFTFEQLKEEEKMFSDRKRAYLVEQYGADHVAALEGETEDREKTFEALGVTRKEMDAEYEQHLENELAEKVAAAATEQSKGIVQEVLDKVVEALNVPGLQETLTALSEDIQETKAFGPRLDNLEEAVTQLKETEDQKIADALAPVTPFNWNFAASRSSETEIKEEDLSEEEQEEVEKASKAGNGQFSWVQSIAGSE